MNKILTLLIPFLLLFLYGGCSSNNGRDDLICDIQEMQSRFADTDCIAEELVTGCSNISCRSQGEASVSVGNFDDNCTVLDCATLECEQIIIQTDEIILSPGLLTNVVINEANGLPSGLFVVDDMEVPFDCTYIAIN